jgi:hypothetical protein
MGLQRGKTNRKDGSYQPMITQLRLEGRFNATELGVDHMRQLIQNATSSSNSFNPSDTLQTTRPSMRKNSFSEEARLAKTDLSEKQYIIRN